MRVKNSLLAGVSEMGGVGMFDTFVQGPDSAGGARCLPGQKAVAEIVR